MQLSELIGATLKGPDTQPCGRLLDVVARLEGEDPALVVGLLMHRGHDDMFVPIRVVDCLQPSSMIFSVACETLGPFERRAGEVLLGRDIMDSEVIDLRGPRLVRVNNVLLQEEESVWRVVGVDTGTGALVRRLLPRRLRSRQSSTRLLAWGELELLAGEVPLGVIRPDHRRLARMHPADIARIADVVPGRHAIEIVSSLDDELAADTMEEMIDEKQADVLADLDPERAADILERMAPDAAADVLAELEPEFVDDVLRRMRPSDAANVHALLTYSKASAGGLMTTDYVMAPRDLRVGEAHEYLREQIQETDLVYYIYVVEEEQERVLVGVTSLRDLWLAGPEQRFDEVMMHDPQRIGPEDPAGTVAQMLSEYNLLSLPVTDEEGRLLGVVTIDDALEVLLPAELRRSVPRIFR